MIAPSQTTEAHVVIAGSGLVGTLAAVVLQQVKPQWHIELIETRREQQQTNDPRALALSRRTVWAFQQYGLWSTIAKLVPNLASHAIEKIHISDTTGPGSAKLEQREFGDEALGYVVPAQAVMGALSQKRDELNIPVRYETTISHIAGSKSSLTLRLNDKEELATKLLLSCDGSASQMRELLGVDEFTQDYEQMAIAAEIEVDPKHQQVAYERFTPQGPMALLPIGNRQYSMVWCGEHQDVQRLMELPEKEFLNAAMNRFGSRAGVFKRADRLAAFPLKKITVDRFCGYRWALLGNACHTLHPVAGQGYNLGVRDVIVLAERVRNEIDPGKNEVLTRYQKARETDYRNVVGFTDSIVHIFSSQDKLASFARRCGLKSLRLCGGLRNTFASKAMGFETESSRWD